MNATTTANGSFPSLMTLVLGAMLVTQLALCLVVAVMATTIAQLNRAAAAEKTATMMEQMNMQAEHTRASKYAWDAKEARQGLGLENRAK